MEQHRGHQIEYSQGAYRYKDTLGKVSDNPNRACRYCGLSNTKEGHDGCLGELPGLMNACCGHGNLNETYVQFLDEYCIRGFHASIIQSILKQYKKNAL